jgi:hypothetical protein
MNLRPAILAAFGRDDLKRIVDDLDILQSSSRYFSVTISLLAPCAWDVCRWQATSAH